MTSAPQTTTAEQTVSGLGDSPPPSGATSPAVLHLDQRTYDRSLDCVHCGLCLPACPTYTTNGLEADSPRGRIYLMKGLADGKIQPTDSVIRHLDLCLDCRACETACPSGVVYHELIEETRANLASTREPAFIDRLMQWVFFHVFTRPNRLKLALLPARLAQRIGLWGLINSPAVRKLLPAQIDKMQQMMPARGPVWEKNLDPFYPAKAPDGVKKATVSLLQGCVGSVLFQHVNRQTIALLQHAGCDVLVPPAQGCCGAIHHHAGHEHEAQAMARTNIDALGGGVSPSGAKIDYIVNNIAGCGAMLKDYPHLLRDDPAYAVKAQDFAKRVRDVSELLVALKPEKPTRTIDRTVTYHHACHLAHAQRVTEPPLEMLRWVPGLRLVPLPESDMCCGAAGTYNLTEPEMARQLAQRKIKHIQSTGGRVCATGNVGCAMQIQSEADRLGVDLHVTHPVSLLYEAYFGPSNDGE